MTGGIRRHAEMKGRGHHQHIHDRARIRPALGNHGAGLDDAAFGEISRALVDHLVLFFRGQVLTPEQKLGFSARFGANGRSGWRYQISKKMKMNHRGTETQRT